MPNLKEVLADFLKTVEPRIQTVKTEAFKQAQELIDSKIKSLPSVEVKSGIDGKDGRDGKDGQPGADGKDGLNLEDFSAKLIDDRNLVLALSRGDLKKEFILKLPVILDRGVYTEKDYEKGDAVTFGGSLWIAQKDTPSGKPGESKDWRLAVKKGRDLK